MRTMRNRNIYSKKEEELRNNFVYLHFNNNSDARLGHRNS